MSGLVRSRNLEDPDGFYAALVAAHGGLTDEASELFNARLVLILANHIGDPEILREALTLARGGLAPAPRAAAGAAPPGGPGRGAPAGRPRAHAGEGTTP